MRDYAETVDRLRRCEQFKCRDCEYESISGCRMKLNAEAADAIEELLAKVPTWISVEDELPDDWKPVLAYDPIGHGEIGIAFIVGSLTNVVWRGVGFTNTAYPANVTHWMPLPEPPKEDA